MAKQFSRLSENFILGGHSIKNVPGITHIQNFGGSTKSFILGMKYARFIKKHTITHIFSREENLLFFTLLYARFLGGTPKVMFEVHALMERSSYFLTWVLKRADYLVALTHPGKDDLVKKGFNSKKIYVLPDGVNLSLFQDVSSQEEARRKLGLLDDEKIILYTGHLYDWKGVETLARASIGLPHNARVYFVGGTERDIKKFKVTHGDKKQITVVGYVPHTEVPLWLSASDVLVLPNSGKEQISRVYTSPMKLFEYMASGRPIVASNLPSIRDILNEENAVFFKADDAESLHSALKEVCVHIGDFTGKATQARKEVLQYSWEERAQKILSILQ
jgi:glycosyltransferase involved in cell wall biosynthesis